jgi:3-isopropylmalate dehydratase small subunit
LVIQSPIIQRLNPGGNKMKVLKLSKDSTTNNVIIASGLKAGTLKDHVLVADDSFGENGSNEQVQSAINAIKSAGIEYVIAPGFAEEFYKNAVDMGLRLLKCSDSKSLEKGDNIEVHLSEGLMLNIDTEQECKFKPM